MPLRASNRTRNTSRADRAIGVYRLASIHEPGASSALTPPIAQANPRRRPQVKRLYPAMRALDGMSRSEPGRGDNNACRAHPLSKPMHGMGLMCALQCVAEIKVSLIQVRAKYL